MLKPVYKKEMALKLETFKYYKNNFIIMPLKIRCRWCGAKNKYLDVFSNTLHYKESNFRKKILCGKCNMPLFKLKHDDGSEYSFSEYKNLAKSCFFHRILPKKQKDTTHKSALK